MSAYPSKAKFAPGHPKLFLNFNEVFRPIKMLGEGGFGSTHLIVDKISGKKYALKLLHNKGFDKDDYYREVSALINLSAEPSCDPNIVCYYNHFMLNGFLNSNMKYYAILMEYIEGMTLAEFDEKYRLSVNDILYIGLWITDMLKYLHSKGFSHNDISVHNIMVTKKKQLKLIDLGATCNIKVNGYLECGFNRIVNIYYQSPEIQAKKYDPKKHAKTSDIYAAGMLLYKLLTGKRPYPQNKNLDIIGPYQNIRNAPCINNALKSMLTINPDERATASQAHKLLEKCF